MTLPIVGLPLGLLREALGDSPAAAYGALHVTADDLGVLAGQVQASCLVKRRMKTREPSREVAGLSAEYVRPLSGSALHQAATGVAAGASSRGNQAANARTSADAGCTRLVYATSTRMSPRRCDAVC